MSIDESNAHYAGFLRSGPYPMLPRTFLGRHIERFGRVGGSFALALLAAGAGYVLTQWLLPSRATPSSQRADKGNLFASITRLSSPPGFDVRGDHERVQRAFTSGVSSDHPFAQRRSAAKSDSGSDAQQVAAIVGSERRFKRRTNDVPEVSVGAEASASGLPVAGSQGELEQLSAEGLRMQLIADRVRALDEAHSRAADPDLGGVMLREAPVARRAVTARARTGASVKPSPSSVHAPGMPLQAAVSVEELDVRGSLSASNVRRGLERLKPALAECYEHAAQRAGHKEFGRMEVSLTIDEAGGARAPHVQGAELPGLRACLHSVASKLVSQPPDTGTVRATIVLAFSP